MHAQMHTPARGEVDGPRPARAAAAHRRCPRRKSSAAAQSWYTVSVQATAMASAKHGSLPQLRALWTVGGRAARGRLTRYKQRSTRGHAPLALRSGCRSGTHPAFRFPAGPTTES